MNQKDLYRAIGNISDRHIVNVRGRHSVTGTHSIRDSSYERTIVMDVVKQEKIRLRIFAVAAAVLVAAGAAAAALSGTKKDKKEYKEKKIENYFREDDGFGLPEGDIFYPEQLHADENGIYFTGYMSFGSGNSSPVISLYSISEKDIKVIEPEECEAEYFTAVSLSDNDAWIECKLNNGERELMRFDTHTLKTTGRIPIDKDEWIADVTEKEDGTYFVRKCLMENYVSDYIFSTYDSDLNLISEKSVMNRELIDSEAMFGGNVVSDDGSYYMIYSDPDEVYTLYKYSPEDELIYSINDVTADLEDVYCGVFLSDVGNPVVFSCDSEGRIYYFDELDSEDGVVVNRYEISAELSDEWSYISAYMTRGSHEGYELTYFSDKKLYGCSSENDKTEMITDLSGMFKESVSVTSAAVHGDLILLSGEYAEESETGTYICQTDYSGKVLNRNKLSNISDCNNPSIRKIITDEKGEIWVLITDDNNNRYSAVNLNSDLTEKKTVALDGISYTQEFITDISGRLAVYDNDSGEIIFYDADGSRMYSEKTAGQVCFFESDGKCYAASSDEDGNKTVIYSIDFDKRNISELNILDFEIKNILNSFGKYDAYFVLSDGISGYSIKDNYVEELINYIDSDLEFVPQGVSVYDENTLVCQYAEMNETYSINLAVLKRVDDETLKNIQERKILNIAAGYLSENIISVIKDFNRTSENYRIHIDDYSKYIGTKNRLVPGYFSNSGLSALESEFVNGNIPDMILFGSDFDMLRYIGFNAFADINDIITEDLSDDSRYFENIIKAYQCNGKQVTLPLTYKLICMSGKNENTDGKTSFTASELLEMDSKMNTFFMESYDNLTELMISSNITEFVDTNEYTCDFENEKFKNIIELIKKNGISQEEYIESVYLGDRDANDYSRALADDLCRFKPVTVSDFSSSVIGHELYNHLENTLYTGFPSEKSNGIIINPELTAAVFSSSENKAGAAEFLEYMMSDDVQYQNCTLYNFETCFPVNKTAYMKLFEKEKSEESSQTTDCYGKRINLKSPDEDTLEKVNSLISSASVTLLSDSKIREIINEQTSLYYSNVQSTEETAKNIQNKVSMYLKEIK